MRRYAALVVGFAVALACARLGIWQLDRLDDRRRNNATVEERRSRPVLSVDAPNALTDSMTYRRVRVQGRADYAREVVVVGRSRRGVPGVHVVTPIVTDDGTAVLLERRWSPSPDAATVDLFPLREDSVLSATGIFMPPGRIRPISQGAWPLRVASLHPSSLAPRFPYPIWPLSVRRTSPGPGGIDLVPAAPLTEGSHRSYAVQWFAFAVIASIGSVVLTRKLAQAPPSAD